MITKPQETLLLVSERDDRTLPSVQLGVPQCSTFGSAIPDSVNQVIIRVPAMPPADLEETGEEDLAELREILKATVHQVQETAMHLQNVKGGCRSIVLLLSAQAVLGKESYSLNSVIANGALSFARTIAIELKKDDISVNTVIHGDVDPEEQTAVHALFTAYRLASHLTGQETYTDRGANLGRIKP